MKITPAKLFFLLWASSSFPFIQVFSQTGLSDVSSWAYQLQNIDISEIESNPTFDLIVIDYSADGSSDQVFTSDEISRIQASGKKVLSYISIGEAEDYRFYWQESWDANHNGKPDAGAPDWLGEGNPDWEGNYKVRFWDPDWQDIVFTYIDTIISRGYDGIYMDIVDGYYYWTDEVSSGKKSDADSLMIGFIRNIKKYTSARASRPFYLVPQNGEYIIVEANVTEALRQEYLQLIDGIGIEDLFFYGNKDENNSWNPDTERIELLADYRAASIPVFSVEYLTTASLIEKYIEEAVARGFIPYAATRELDRLDDGLTSVFDSHFTSNIDFYLYQNYPNPFNSNTVFSFSLGQSICLKYTIVNAAGQVVETKNVGVKSAGHHEVTVSSEGISSGLYFFILHGANFQTGKKFIIVK